MKKLNFCAAYSVKRLDLYLNAETEYSRSRIKKLCEEEKIFVNGKPAQASKTVKQGDEIEIIIEDAVVDEAILAENIPIDIIYQDQDFAVINKPQGLTVHAGGGTHGNTLVNALLYHLDSLSGINGVIRPGIVHRIDKDTSGLLVVAKNDAAHISLSKQIQEKTLKRIYLALLEGSVKADNGHIDTFLGRSEKDRKLMAVKSSGRNAVTDYRVITRYVGFTLCEFSLKTGRTHQIRVHAKYIGHPVVGDKAYGYKKQKFSTLKGQLLHAAKLILKHPSTGEEMTFTAPLPNYFSEVLTKLKPIEE